MEDVEVVEIDISFVKQDNHAVLEGGAELLDAGVVMVTGFLNDRVGGGRPES